MPCFWELLCQAITYWSDGRSREKITEEMNECTQIQAKQKNKKKGGGGRKKERTEGEKETNCIEVTRSPYFPSEWGWQLKERVQEIAVMWEKGSVDFAPLKSAQCLASFGAWRWFETSRWVSPTLLPTSHHWSRNGHPLLCSEMIWIKESIWTTEWSVQWSNQFFSHKQAIGSFFLFPVPPGRSRVK